MQTSVTDPDVDLVIARENFNSGSFQQSIYFRRYDGTSDWDALGADIQFSGGISVVDVIIGESSMNGSDAVWGISGANYAGVDRGMVQIGVGPR